MPSISDIKPITDVQVRIPGQNPSANPTTGILLMLAAFLAYTGIDTLSKIMTQQGYHAIMITWGRVLAQLIMVAPILIRRGGLGALTTRHPVLQTVRAFSMLVAGICFVSGLAYLPLATMTAINFVNPFFITILSIFVLKEVVGGHRWLAIAAGFIGAIIIIRPGTMDFHPASLYALVAALAWAISVIVTRLVQDNDSGMLTVLYTAAISVAALSCIVWWFWTPLTTMAVFALIGIGICSTVGQLFMIAALRHASPSTLAPIGYSQIVWATLFGVILFGNFPDAWTWTGTMFIVASGIYVWHRERQAAPGAIEH